MNETEGMPSASRWSSEECGVQEAGDAVPE